MAVIFVRAVIAHSKLGLIPVTRGSHQWCQGPSDSSTILPCEGTLVLIPNDFNAVPVIVLPRCMEIMVNLKETRNTIDKFICAEVVTAGRERLIGPIFRSTVSEGHYLTDAAMARMRVRRIFILVNSEVIALEGTLFSE